jgi:hypothetical protein
MDFTAEIRPPIRAGFLLHRILRATIEIPQEHATAGIAIDYPTVGLAGKNTSIHSSKEKPECAAVAVKHRGYWFNFDDTEPSLALTAGFGFFRLQSKES